MIRPARPRLGLALLVGVVLAGTVSCGSDAKPAVAAPTTTASATPTTTPPPPPPPPVVWPLTGLVSGVVPPHPAVAVKIENSIDARPQSGLNAADVVWEEVVEGGITRFVAVYHSNLPEEIGPVRSVRPMDPAITAPLHGLFAASGGQAGYVDAVAAAGLQVLTLDAGSDGFYRSTDRYAPHNVYASLTTLLAQADAEHLADPPAQFVIASNGAMPSTGSPAGQLALTLSGVAHPSWTWSAPDAAWLRAEDDEPATQADGAQLRATNVVVLRVEVDLTSGVDPAGNPIPETVLVGSGEAIVAVNGTTVPATWTKPDTGAPLTLTGPDGQPVRLAPGTTWFELVPTGSGDAVVG